MKVVINPSFAQFHDFVWHLPDVFEREGETIYEGRNRIKVFEVKGVVLNVKRFKRPIYLNRLIYTWFRSSKAKRAYAHALRLLAKGFETPAPVAYILCSNEGLLEWSYFVSMQIPDSFHTLYEVGQGSVETYKDVFYALGRYTALLHRKGVYHKDYSPGNILYRRELDGVRFVLIDVNRMAFGPVSLRRGCANFARIWGNEAAFRIMAESYAEALGVDKATCARLIFRYRNRFWKRYARKYPIKFDLR